MNPRPQIVRTSFSHDTQQLAQSLPRFNAWGDTLILYKGFWTMPYAFESTLRSEKNFQARDSDILVVTVPKSGTTWLKSLVFAITKRSEYPPSDPNHPFHETNSHELIPFLELIYGDTDNPHLSHLPAPRLFSTHNAYNVLPESIRTTNTRIIYLCRDVKDTLVSMWHFLNGIALETEGQQGVPLEEAFELFCKGITDRGPIWDHVLGYWNASLKEPHKVLFLKYEDLKGDTICEVKKIAEFLGVPFTAEEESGGVAEEIVKMCSMESLRNLKVNQQGGKRFLAFMENKLFFRKGEVGDWVNYLTPSMAEKLQEIMEQNLQINGLL